MSLSEKMKIVASNMQEGVKDSTISMVHILLRLVSGFFIGITVSLIFQELIGFGTFSLLFCLVVMLSALYKIMSAWSISKILIFDLIFILVGQLLKMYILLAP